MLMKKYHHITKEERYAIWSASKNGISPSQIARTLDVAPSTITREIERNSGKKGYHPCFAQTLADERKTRLRYNHRIKYKVKQRILKYLTEEQWSPEQISGYLALDNISVSHEYIYQLVRADKAAGGKLYFNLRHRGKHRKRPVGICPQIPDRVSIHNRPAEADDKHFGNFELDTIIGKDNKGAIVTLVERSTNYMLMKKSPNGKDHKVVAQIVKDLLFPYRHWVKTITTDNGSEFRNHKDISRYLGATIYFADPYSSWQKGAIENTNKLIRQYIPKGANFDDYTDEQILQIQYKINRRPREKLHFSTPKDCFFKFF